tara:strand:+ start:575 stop:703 length:129 start_codon:yes stop_codon:yes gene_type:complete
LYRIAELAVLAVLAVLQLIKILRKSWNRREEIIYLVDITTSQ